MKLPFMPKFKEGDEVINMYHSVRYRIGKRYWWFGWRYDLHTEAYGIVYVFMKESAISPAPEKVS